MAAPLTQGELNNVLDFIGYGSLDAKVWFLGMEEAGGGEQALRTRAGFRVVEDCAEAHKRLGIEKHHWGRKVIQRTWRGMCYIMLALQEQEPSRESIRQYQADWLGRRHGSTLLAELLPLPRPKAAGWDYAELIPQFATARDYVDAIKPRRIDYLRGMIAESQPEVVIGYGKEYWTDFEAIFPGMTFVEEDRFRLATSDDRLVILTSHFTSRAMNGRLDNVVSIIQRNRVQIAR